MVKTTVYLEPETALALQHLANQEGRSQAELIREALQLYTRRVHRPKLKGVGKYRSGRSDISVRAEELLKEAVRNKKWP